MFIRLAEVLDRETLARIAEVMAHIRWADGRATAGPVARLVKENRQAASDDPNALDIRATCLRAIKANTVLNASARPARYARPLLSLSTEGGHYGPHIDNAIMVSEDGQRMRTDLSFTLGLVDPGSYSGGELVIHEPGYIQRVKPAAGELFLYPSSTVHEVTPVTEGRRIVCVGWIESMVRDPRARETLFDLENLRAHLRTNEGYDDIARLTLDKAIANLLRLHATP